MKALFDQISQEMSELTTKRYSTSFSLGISFLHKEIQKPIYAIYGFVRFADEIVDTFHGYDKEKLLADFKVQTYQAIEAGISLNPILNSFQWAVNRYQIPTELIDTFLDSMEMDLQKHTYDQGKYETYILGSAEVVFLTSSSVSALSVSLVSFLTSVVSGFAVSSTGVSSTSFVKLESKFVLFTE